MRNQINAEQFALLQKNTETRSRISGTGFVSWKALDRNVAAPGVLLVSWPDQMRLEIQDPVGGILALLVLSGGKFWWYASDQREILTGPAQNLSRVVHLPFPPAELIRVFLARPNMEQWKNAKGEGFTLHVDKPFVEDLTWSDRLHEPLIWRRSLPGRQYEVGFEDYTVRFGASFPEKIILKSIAKASAEETLTWSWRDWQPNISADQKIFQIPQTQTFGRKIKTLP